jgi:hypothetical protein
MADDEPPLAQGALDPEPEECLSVVGLRRQRVGASQRLKGAA